MAYVSEAIKTNFNSRLNQAKKLIKDYNIDYECIGIVGSFAREEFTNRSDIDICIITNNRPNRCLSGSLREEAELLGVDIIFVSSDYFNESQDRFACNIRRDFREISL